MSPEAQGLVALIVFDVILVLLGVTFAAFGIRTYLEETDPEQEE